MKTQLLISLAVCLTASASSIVANGGFETGDFTGWSISGACNGVGTANPVCNALDSDPGAHSGLYAGYLGSNPSGVLSQILVTTVGDAYDLSFWMAVTTIGGSATPNSISVSWDGSTIYSATNLPSSPYTLFTFSGLTASTADTPLVFNFFNAPADFVLDDVSASAVPEPSAMGLCIVGLGVMVAMRRSLGSLDSRR